MNMDWYQKSMNAHALNGKAERTQEACSRALRMLCEFHGKEPKDISEAELEAYFLHRRNSTVYACGLRLQEALHYQELQAGRLQAPQRSPHPGRGCYLRRKIL